MCTSSKRKRGKMGFLNDLTGKTFGKLLVISINRKDKQGHIFWNCICECGLATVVRSDCLKLGRTQSCGCIAREKTIKRSTKHNLSRSRIYRIWRSMITRCEDQNSSGWVNYGGRGITICSEWANRKTGFINFLRWSITNGYSDNLSIDRIDNSKGYAPNNCRWSNAVEQANNRRNSKKITFEDKEYTCAELARKLGKTYKQIYKTIVKAKK